MPTTAVFKNKWNVFITKLSPPSPLEHVHNQRRRRSSCSENNNNSSNASSTTRINEQFLKRRKHSDAMSVGTFESTISIKDKFRQAIPFFRRRSSASHIDEPSQPQPQQQQQQQQQLHASPQQSQVTVDYYEQLERLQQLYTLAVDEVCIYYYAFYCLYFSLLIIILSDSLITLKIPRDHPITQAI